jgi:hypothetical protein
MSPCVQIIELILEHESFQHFKLNFTNFQHMQNLNVLQLL